MDIKMDIKMDTKKLMAKLMVMYSSAQTAEQNLRIDQLSSEQNSQKKLPIDIIDIDIKT
jgi:Tfp pilus assembly protein PilN